MKRLTSAALLIIGSLLGYWGGVSSTHTTESKQHPHLALPTLQKTSVTEEDHKETLRALTEKQATTSTPQTRFEQLRDYRSLLTIGNLNASLELIESMNTEELKYALRNANAFSSDNVNDYTFTSFLITALSEQSPEMALRFLLEPASRHLLNDIHIHEALFSNWAVQDPKTALAAATQLETSQHQNYAINAIIVALANVDSTQAFEILQNEGSDWGYIHNKGFFTQLSRRDPDSALQLLSELASVKQREGAIHGIIAGLSSTDPGQAATLAESIQNKDEQDQAYIALMRNWMANDKDAALTYIQNLNDPTLQEKAARLAVATSLYNDPETAITIGATYLTGRTYDNCMINAIQTISYGSPTRASELLSELPFGRAYSESVKNIAGAWPSKDTAKGYLWAKELPPGKERTAAIKTLLKSYGWAQPENAKSLLSEIGNDQERSELTKSIARKLADAESPKSAISWLQTLPDQHNVEAAHANVIWSWAHDSPAEAATYLQQLKNNSEALPKESIHYVATAWARKDTEAATGWALSIENDDEQAQAIRSISKEWLEHDVYATTEWVASLEPSKGRDAAIANIIKAVNHAEPDSAFAWATSMSDPTQRSKQTTQIIQQWATKNTESAELAIEESDLPEDEKQMLLNEINKDSTQQ